MKTRLFERNWFSAAVPYLPTVWTVVCFVGTWYIILIHGILGRGLIALAVTFLFASTIWAIPFASLVLVSLLLTPEKKSEPPL